MTSSDKDESNNHNNYVPVAAGLEKNKQFDILPSNSIDQEHGNVNITTDSGTTFNGSKEELLDQNGDETQSKIPVENNVNDDNINELIFNADNELRDPDLTSKKDSDVSKTIDSMKELKRKSGLKKDGGDKIEKGEEAVSNSEVNEVEKDEVDEDEEDKDDNEDDEDEEDEEDEDDDEDDTEPPKLKYSRMTQLPPNFFTKDPVSACTFLDDYFIFATHSGIIHICNATDFSPIRTFKAHRASVLSVYTDGTYFALASMDGTVVIGSLADAEDIIAYNFNRPVHFVVLLENYASKRSFISGGMSGEIIFSTKGWLGKKADYVYSKGSGGPIVGLYKVGDDLIVWMNDDGIHLFQISTRKIIKKVEKPEDAPRGDLYWPRMILEDPDRLVVAWGNYIWSLKISVKPKDDLETGEGSVLPVSSSGMSRILPSSASLSFRSVHEKKIEVEHIFKLEDLVCGIASFKDDLWMVLIYKPPTIVESNNESTRKKFHNPEIQLINSMTGEVEFEQELGLKDVTNLGLNDFRLGYHVETIPKYFIVSAKEGVIAEEFQLNDRLEWYLEKENYFKAWELGQHLVTPQKRLSFGIQYVDSLVRDDEWIRAAEFLIELLPPLNQTISVGDNESGELTVEGNLQELDQQEDQTNSSLNGKEELKEWVDNWETWCRIFISSNHVEELTQVIPVTTLISKDIYDDILKYWIENSNDGSKLKSLISAWSIDVYNVENIQKILEEKVIENNTSSQLQLLLLLFEPCLIELYNKTNQQASAVPYLVKLKDENIIMYLDQNHLLLNFISEIPKFIELQVGGEDNLHKLPIQQLQDELMQTMDILIEHRMEISPHQLVPLFRQANLAILNYFYLFRLQSVDVTMVQDFGNELVELYANFNRLQLLPFLTHNDNYDVDLAIETCQLREYFSELVYLLGKIGENKRAINLVIHKLDDAKLAIEFATRLKDQDTWDIVIDESMTRPHFIRQLIELSDLDESINQFYDPMTILNKLDVDKMGDMKDESEQLLKRSVMEYDSRQQLNQLINQIILRMILNKSQQVAQVLKDMLLRGIAVNFEDETDLTKRREWEQIVQRYEAIVL